MTFFLSTMNYHFAIMSIGCIEDLKPVNLSTYVSLARQVWGELVEVNKGGGGQAGRAAETKQGNLQRGVSTKYVYVWINTIDMQSK